MTTLRSCRHCCSHSVTTFALVNDGQRLNFARCEDCGTTAPIGVWQQPANEAIERKQFEADVHAYYMGLKAAGWSSPEEGGDPADPKALLWRESTGKYGVLQIEAAWKGWLMKAVR